MKRSARTDNCWLPRQVGVNLRGGHVEDALRLRRKLGNSGTREKAADQN
jgi:hypothetical protein